MPLHDKTACPVCAGNGFVTVVQERARRRRRVSAPDRPATIKVPSGGETEDARLRALAELLVQRRACPGSLHNWSDQAGALVIALADALLEFWGDASRVTTVFRDFSASDDGLGRYVWGAMADVLKDDWDWRAS